MQASVGESVVVLKGGVRSCSGGCEGSGAGLGCRSCIYEER